ncbi:491_t:CDS:1 [Ambispora gerdemannii]|uniref:491_t:CDS:1 n=1 Tax=Ambispora gerdemannii TaxID=144530 RepID=A0A9N9CG36_9GLOM|nr:491_t:CDS:1 [Ambispora gerdemannii]
MGIKGHLDLSEFVDLESFTLECSRGITSLDVSKNSKLVGINCRLVPELNKLIMGNISKLERIQIFGNKISANLKVFSQSINLHELEIGSNEYYGSACDFYGSLKALENCENLKYVDISNNKRIIGGLEHLPLNNLCSFCCSNTTFQSILRPYDYDIKAWKLVNYSKKALAKHNPELLIEELGKKIRESRITLDEIKQNKSDKTNKRIERLESKIIILEEIRRQAIEKNETFLRANNLENENQKLKIKIAELETQLKTEQQKIEQIAQIIVPPKNY